MIYNSVNDIDCIGILERNRKIDMKLEGIFADSVTFIERNQIYDVDLWKKFVNQYRIQIDGENGLWRCEYWGKMMRGACMIISYTQNDGFYRIVEASVRDMLTTQEENGRFSTYKKDVEFTSWDLWGRKYVMLGFMYFLEICRDDTLAQHIISALCRHADYIVERIGTGKIEICKSSKNWKGLNSCSILEPFVRLYKLTGNKSYLDFSEYIISSGFIDGGNLIELALENKIAPHQYPVVKAYEMMSCFEGLLQYYRITGNERYKKATLNLGYRIIDSELSVIGCSGCTHELFDNTSVKQTQTGYDNVVQETCVAVTWMKFALALLEITGDSRFADAIEQTFYNCYIGSLNTKRATVSRYPDVNDLPQVLPFDSYSPLTADIRGKQIGGYNSFSDGTFYGCCACIGAAGSGMIPQYALMHGENCIVINFYEKGIVKTFLPCGDPLTVSIDTDYPVNGRIIINLDSASDSIFDLKLRIPSWCKNVNVSYKGKTARAEHGYYTLSNVRGNHASIILDMEMTVERILPPRGACNEDLFAAYRRGPIVLAADARITDPENPINVICDENGIVNAVLKECKEIPDCLMCIELPTNTGTVRLIDYASAGKTWDARSKCAAWLYRK